MASGALSPLAVLPDGWTIAGQSHGRALTVKRPDATSDTSGNVLNGVFVVHSSAGALSGRSRAQACQPLTRSPWARHGGDFARRDAVGGDAATAMTEDGTAPPQHWSAEVLAAVAQARGAYTDDRDGWDLFDVGTSGAPVTVRAATDTPLATEDPIAVAAHGHDDMYDARDTLVYIRDLARCRWSAHMRSWRRLARAACEVDPHVELPPIVGGVRVAERHCWPCRTTRRR